MNIMKKKFIIVYAVVLFLSLVILRGTFFKQSYELVLEPDSLIYVRVFNEKTGKVMNMELNDYIVGVVSGEMPANYEMEALKAQAVAARTYAVRKIDSLGGNPCKPFADLCTSSRSCQAWKSDEDLIKLWGDNYETYYKKIRNAVFATGYDIILYDGEPIEALYHSNSGGMTEDNENVFSGDIPYLKSVISVGEEKYNDYSAEKVVSADEFVKTINDNVQGAGMDKEKIRESVKIVSRYDSGRVELIKLANAEISGKQFRKLFDIRSANFTIEFRNDEVVISTIGFGHGVGMSQTGANTMAKSGCDYKQILEYYYSGVEIVDNAFASNG